ncbi:AraC family transcriptional regulator [Sphingobium sp. 22B]|uniref:GlxA family transcriptional regulator n=1 Tax=unclassified Sphingobium TaxID=2611147 RepID=UPI000780362D|nr:MULTISPECIES: GlxA family transcriptional regulator [unclassified Sphingobium]KXU32699.1 AraC family transcriptional regulator [Sphingobium sp. AM]KYC32777.1 AraC family transcriptional regulator [Sphingobium sp. 22B]OAP31667.1 AraC family transcriptional regulator [Sphingobium sp. 20006FA]
MRQIGFLLAEGFQMMGLAPIPAFEFANLDLGRTSYGITVMSERGGAIPTSCGLRIETEKLTAFPDTLMVVGGFFPQPTSAGLRDYIAEAGQRGCRVAGVCTGAFALADAGLLSGRTATTHWAHAWEMRHRFPDITVDEDRIFIADNGIWTSAGMSSAIDLTLALIEEDHGADVSRSVARRLVVYHRRPSGQSQFSAMLELEPRSDRVRRALAHAKENLRNPLTVEELAESANLSPRQFSRLFREETGQSPAKAVERLRVEAARAMLGSGTYSMDLVARETGFSDRNRMRRAFLRAYGQPPQNLRRTQRLMTGSGVAPGGRREALPGI